MMLDFRDFVPQLLSHDHSTFLDGFWKDKAVYETFEAAVEAANDWICDQGVRVITVETVVLPNIWSPKEEGSQDPALPGGFVPWHQFVRVWFEKNG